MQSSFQVHDVAGMTEFIKCRHLLLAVFFRLLLLEMDEQESVAPAKKRRFTAVSDADLARAEDARVPSSTKTATAFWIRTFKSFCDESDISINLSTCSGSELNDVLCRFYLGLRNKNGHYYKRASYLAARAAISRHVVVELSRPELNLFREAVFRRSNHVLDGHLKTKKLEGEEPAVEHKISISDEDIERLRMYFEDVLESPDPVKLAFYCWYNLTLHCALRSSEVQVALKKEDIVFDTDGEGGAYATIRRDFLSKNCRGGVDGREFETCGRIQEPRQVEALKKMITKLNPNVDRLFQRALMKVTNDDSIWYMRSPLGRNVLGDMLSRLSKTAGLSRRYTNHCLRSTAITMLKKAGVDDRAVCRVTGHKNIKSLDSYNKPSDFEQRRMAKAIDGATSSSSLAVPASVAVPAIVADTDNEEVVACSSQASCEESEEGAAMRMPSFSFNRSTFNNMTINLQGVYRQKKRLSMKLTKKAK